MTKINFLGLMMIFYVGVFAQVADKSLDENITGNWFFEKRINANHGITANAYIEVDSYGFNGRFANNYLWFTSTPTNPYAQIEQKGVGSINFRFNNTDKHIISSTGIKIGATSSTDLPVEALDVNGSVLVNNGWLRVKGQRGLYFQDYGGGFYMKDTQWIRTWGNKNFYHNTGTMRTDGTFQVGPGGNRFLVNTSGKVGVGTTNPKSELHINSGRKGLLVNGTMGGDNFIDYQAVFSFTDTGITESGIKINKKNGGNNFDLLNAFYKNEELFVIRSSGNIGIGVANPNDKLEVAGTIKAQEIEVTLASMEDLNLNGTLAANNITVKANGNTADFVFSDTYNLKDLTEVENFIKTNKHLPDIPSAEDMEKQGVNLAEMNKLLLQKVEELTLYAIEKDKEVGFLKDKVETIEGDKNKEQEEREKINAEMEALKDQLYTIKEMLMINCEKQK